ncbi:hemoglobin [Pedobacter sp. UYP30]|uniref:group III truncated hemoglobin n=1 Tax=Pedobacter sp. UYP30 TaxID=1756400 RepID=UPI003399D824
MEALTDIATLEDIKLLVDTFYGNVQKNELIGPIFNSRLAGRWEMHLEKMYTFWQTVLLNKHTYFGSPFPPHARMPIEKQHFDTWLSLWRNVIDQHFKGEVADEAKWRGDKMAELFMAKIDYYKTSSATPLS